MVDGRAAGQPLYRGQPTVEPTYQPSPAEWPPKRDAVADRKGGGFWAKLAPAVAFAGVLATALTGYMAYRSNLQLTHLRGDLERLQAENLQLMRVMDVVRSDQLRLVALGGTESAPDSRGRVL